MATSPNYGWLEPDNTDLVKNGALAIRTLGNAIDTTMATMTPKSIVDAKGDLIAASAADTPARLAVGNNGETLVADSSTSTGLRYQGSQSAGRNRILNSDFSCWQRGTSFTNAASLAYTTDRFFISYNGTGGANTISRQTGPAIVGTGVEAQQFFRYNQTSAISGGSYNVISQRIENVSTLAGQTVTISFYAKADSAWAISEIGFEQDFGSGGSSPVYTVGTAPTLSTSWARYSINITLPSITGKTIGTSNSLRLYIGMKINSTFTFDIYGVQVEAGSVATAFQTATGTIQGELAACQRYYYRIGGTTQYNVIGVGQGKSSTVAGLVVPFPVQMRTAVTTLDYSLMGVFDGANIFNASSVSINGGQTSNIGTYLEVTTTGLTQFRPYVGIFQNSTSAYIGFSAEL
jgi:hypothetical protein